jgi:hypothetical protein
METVFNGSIKFPCPKASFSLSGDCVARERWVGWHTSKDVIHYLPVNPLGAGGNALARLCGANLRSQGDGHHLVHADCFLHSDFIDLF